MVPKNATETTDSEKRQNLVEIFSDDTAGEDPIIASLRQLNGGKLKDEEDEGGEVEEGEPEEIDNEKIDEINDLEEGEESEEEGEEGEEEARKSKGGDEDEREPQSIRTLKEMGDFPEDALKEIRKMPAPVRGALTKFIRDNADAKSEIGNYKKYHEEMVGSLADNVGKLAEYAKAKGGLKEEDVEKFKRDILNLSQAKYYEVQQAISEVKVRSYGATVQDFVESVTDEKFGAWLKRNPELGYYMTAMLRDRSPKEHKAFLEVLKPLLTKSRTAVSKRGKPSRTAKKSDGKKKGEDLKSLEDAFAKWQKENG